MSTDVAPAGHQLHCPYTLLQLAEPTGVAGDPQVADVPHVTCPDRRCCVWLDLHSWFGLDVPELPIDEFRLAFTDVAHGGSGLYEKLVVLGTRALETFSEVYVYEQFDPTGIPPDLLGGTQIPEEICRLVWTRKRVERLLSSSSLLAFAKSYLAAAQSLPTELSCVKYVKACIGYSIQLPVAEAQRLFEWMPSLVEHIYWAQRLHVEDHDEDNETLEDIQEYFGYPYSRLIPRIREALLYRGPAVSSTEPPTGRDLLRFFALDYFRSLAEEVNIPQDRQPAWITDETDYFMNSAVFNLFAGCWLNLGPYLAAQTDGPSLPDSETYRHVFEALLAACYVLSPEEKSRVWMMTLIHRLRQIQLLIHLRRLDILTGGPTADIEGFHDVDLHRWSSLSHALQHRQLQWTLAGLDDVPGSMLEEPSRLPPSLFRKHVEAEKPLPKPLGEDKKPPETFFDQLKDLLLPCLRPRRPAYPIALIPEQQTRQQPLELFPLGPLRGDDNAKQFRVPPDKRPVQRDSRQHSFWDTLGAPELRQETAAGPQEYPPPSRVPSTPIFRRTKPPGYSAAGCCRRSPWGSGTQRRLRGCPRNVWEGIPRDTDGVELWRPPGAIFMQPKRRLRGQSPATQISEREPPWLTSQGRSEPREQQQQDADEANLKVDHENEQETMEYSSEYERDDATDMEDIKLKIRYVLPDGYQAVGNQKRPPLDITLYPTLEDAKQKENPALRAVVDVSPENAVDVSGNTLLHGRQLKATFFPNPEDPDSHPIQLDFVGEGPTGSPRVYISSAKTVTTKPGSLKTEVIKVDAKDKKMQRQHATRTKSTASSYSDRTVNTTAESSLSSSRSSSALFSTASSYASSTDSDLSPKSTSSCASSTSSSSSMRSSQALSSTHRNSAAKAAHLSRSCQRNGKESTRGSSGSRTASCLTTSSTSGTETTSSRTTSSEGTASEEVLTTSTHSSKSRSPDTLLYETYRPSHEDLLSLPPYSFVPPAPFARIPKEAMSPTPRTPRLAPVNAENTGLKKSSRKSGVVASDGPASARSHPVSYHYVQAAMEAAPPLCRYVRDTYQLKSLPLKTSAKEEEVSKRSERPQDQKITGLRAVRQGSPSALCRRKSVMIPPFPLEKYYAVPTSAVYAPCDTKLSLKTAALPQPFPRVTLHANTDSRGIAERLSPTKSFENDSIYRTQSPRRTGATYAAIDPSYRVAQIRHTTSLCGAAVDHLR